MAHPSRSDGWGHDDRSPNTHPPRWALPPNADSVIAGGGPCAAARTLPPIAQRSAPSDRPPRFSAGGPCAHESRRPYPRESAIGNHRCHSVTSAKKKNAKRSHLAAAVQELPRRGTAGGWGGQVGFLTGAVRIEGAVCVCRRLWSRARNRTASAATGGTARFALAARFVCETGRWRSRLGFATRRISCDGPLGIPPGAFGMFEKGVDDRPPAGGHVAELVVQ